MAEIAGNTIINSISVALEELSGDNNLDQHRRSAFEKLSLSGLPAPKNEEYKFTNVTKILEKQFNMVDTSPTVAEAKPLLKQLEIDGLEAHKLVFINGKFNTALSDSEALDGVKVTNIADAMTANDPTFLANFNRLAYKNRDAFVQMNTALTNDGAFIEVEANKEIKKPIAIYHISQAKAASLYTNNRHLIVAHQGSQATFIEFNIAGDGVEVFDNVSTEIVISENANIQYYTIQNNNDSAYHLGTTEVLQQRASIFSAYTFTLSGALIRNNLNVAIDGEGCETNMYGLYIVDGTTHVDNHTAVDHVQPHSFSNELYKGILEDSSKGVFNGKVYVRQEAQKTNAFQSNKNILLSDRAVVNTKPQLEIWADDVKCSHGCTTGQLDEEALFYLRARGLSKVSARAMLLYAFAIEVLDHVKIDALKVHLEAIISERLHKNS